MDLKIIPFFQFIRVNSFPILYYEDRRLDTFSRRNSNTLFVHIIKKVHSENEFLSFVALKLFNVTVLLH